MQSDSIPPSLPPSNHDASVDLPGEEAVLVDRRQQKLYSANPDVPAIRRCLAQAMAPDQVADVLQARFGLDRSTAEQYVDAVIRQWPQGRRYDRSAAADLLPADSGPASKPAMERHYRILDSTIALRSFAPPLGSGVDRLLRHLRTAGTDRPDVVLDFVPLERGYGLVEGGRSVENCATIEQAPGLAQSLLVRRALGRSRDFCAVHAGAVRRLGSERCVLLPGPTGSGKSTLVAGLTSEGFELFADETAVLTDAGLLVRPLATGIRVKPGAWDVLSIRYPRLRRAPVHEQPDGTPVRYLSPPEYAVAASGARAPVGWIVFPKFEPVAATELYPISRSAALQRFMPSVLPLRGALESADVERLVHWVAEVRCYELRFSSLNEAVVLIARLCQ